ncbi:MAG: formate/nitrite transporter family protein [Bdellovibrionia bacterium]
MKKLSPEQERETQERMVAPAHIVHEVIVREGDEELERSPVGLAWSGFAAGFSIGLSLMTEGFIHLSLPESSWKHLVVALGYPIGFIALIIARQQLFTENTLRAVVPALANPSRSSWIKVARLWVVVLASNLVGAWLFSYLVARTPVFDPDVHESFKTLGTEAMKGEFGTIFVKAVFAGWIIALMSWMVSSAVHSKLAVIFLMTYLIGVCRLKHVIAGSVDTLYLVWAGGATYGEYLMRFFLPTLLGNVLGGVLLVSIVNHAQATAGDSKQK